RTVQVRARGDVRTDNHRRSRRRPHRRRCDVRRRCGDPRPAHRHRRGTRRHHRQHHQRLHPVRHGGRLRDDGHDGQRRHRRRRQHRSRHGAGQLPVGVADDHRLRCVGRRIGQPDHRLAALRGQCRGSTRRRAAEHRHRLGHRPMRRAVTGRNPNVRKILAVAAAAALLVTATAGAGAADEDAQYPTFDEISPLPLDAVTAPGSSTGTGPNGEPYLYFVSSGSPAVLSVVDVGDGSRVDEHPLPGASGSWMVETAPDGTVYVGSYGEGRLYRYFPAEQRVEDLGTPVAGETFIWALVVATDGTVYGGTGQQGAHVFSYDPDTGETRDYGALADDPSQPLVTHGIAVDEDTIYAGTGAVPRLFEIDIDSGERTELTVPEPVAELKYVYDMDLRGDLLFLRASPDGAPQPLHVYDTATG